MSSLTVEKLNTELTKAGLNEATLVNAPAVKEFVGTGGAVQTGTGSAVHTTPSLLMALGAVLAALQLLL